VLAKVAMLAKNYGYHSSIIPVAAIIRLTDQALLAIFLAEFKMEWLHQNHAAEILRALEHAVGQLRDQALLEQVALKSDNYCFIRFLAIKKLTDRAVLTKLAFEEKDPHFRKLAESRLMELGNKQLTEKDCYGWTSSVDFRVVPPRR